jgi:hypothetical protein
MRWASAMRNRSSRLGFRCPARAERACSWRCRRWRPLAEGDVALGPQAPQSRADLDEHVVDGGGGVHLRSEPTYSRDQQRASPRAEGRRRLHTEVIAMDARSYDVMIVDGVATGLSAALVLGRARRVVVIDAGSPRNTPAVHMHRLLSRDGMPPPARPAAGRAEVTGYGVELVSHSVVSIEPGELRSRRQSTSAPAPPSSQLSPPPTPVVHPIRLPWLSFRHSPVAEAGDGTRPTTRTPARSLTMEPCSRYLIRKSMPCVRHGQREGRRARAGGHQESDHRGHHGRRSRHG